MMTQSSASIVYERPSVALQTGCSLTREQALGQLSHFERRLRRRTRAYFAARERLTIAREEFAAVEALAIEARGYWPSPRTAA